MTVRQLIKTLKKMPPGLEVFTFDAEEGSREVAPPVVQSEYRVTMPRRRSPFGAFSDEQADHGTFSFMRWEEGEPAGWPEGHALTNKPGRREVAFAGRQRVWL